MGWLRRLLDGDPQPSSGRGPQTSDLAHLDWFARNKYGVEAFIEPQTMVTGTTVILIAHDGEWTRRAAGSRDAAFTLARSLEVPVYDVHLTGYPQRMRDYNARQRSAR